MKFLLVKDWMTRDVISVDPDTSIIDAHQLMRANQIRRLPIVKNGRLKGIVTRSDLRGAQPSEATTLSVWEINYLLANLSISEIMTKDVVTARPDDTIERAAELMHQRKIGALPVVDESQNLVGIITESDIFRILIAWFKEEIKERAS